MSCPVCYCFLLIIQNRPRVDGRSEPIIKGRCVPLGFNNSLDKGVFGGEELEEPPRITPMGAVCMRAHRCPVVFASFVLLQAFLARMSPLP